MKHTLALVCGFLFLLCAGCAHKMAPAGPPPPPPAESILESGTQDSLFKGDQAVLSDQDIARILGTHINLSERHHLAILNLSPQSWWSDELAELQPQ